MSQVGYVSALKIHPCILCAGKFPYPFLNQLPLPQGFILMLVLGIVIFYGFFQIGRQVNKGRTRLEKYLAHAGPASETVEGHRVKKQ